jgi:hypothetical protein
MMIVVTLMVVLIRMRTNVLHGLTAITMKETYTQSPVQYISKNKLSYKGLLTL